MKPASNRNELGLALKAPGEKAAWNDTTIALF